MEVKPGYRQSDVGMIPEDWKVTSLGALCEITAGRDLVKRAFSPTGDHRYQFPIYSNALMNKGLYGYSNSYQYETDKITVTGRGDVGHAVYRNTRFCAIGRLLVLSSKRPCDLRFVTEYINNFVDFALESTGVPQLTAPQISTYEVALPPTKAEQQTIAGALSDADALIESLEQLIAKKRALKQGAMQELLIGKRRLPGFEVKRGYKQSELGVIPKDWALRPLLTAVRIAQGQVDPKIEPYKSMFLVGPAHVESATGKLVTRQTAAEQGAISGKYLFAEGDIVYGKINPYLQKAFLADFSGLCSADMYPLKPSRDVSSGFILSVILGHQFTKYAESVSVRSGMPKINRVEMGEFVFPVPTDKAEQSAIAAILSDMDAEIAALEAKLTKVRQLKQGMMQELLTGKIRLV